MKAHQFKHEMTRTSNVFGRAKGVEVVFEGDQAATDGNTIYLPSIPDDANLTGEQVRLMRGYVDHEAGHLRHSNLPLLMDKYEKWGKNNKQGLQVLQNYIEDMWMEERVMHEYPGAKKNLTSTTESVDRRVLEQAKAAPPEAVQTVNADNLGMAIGLAGREDYSGPSNREIWDMLPENMQEWAKEINKHIDECQSTEDNIRLAKAVYKLLEQDPELSSSPEDFDPQMGDDVGDGDDGEPNEAQKTKQDLSDQWGKGKPQKARGEQQDGGPPSLEDIIETDVPGGIGHPEGDYVGAYRVFSTAEDEVLTWKHPRGKSFQLRTDVGRYDKTRESISGHTNTLKSRLRRGLLSKDKRDWDYGRQQGRIDSKRLVAAVTGSSQVYKQRTDREDMNTAVMLLIDQSGSMDGSKIKVARECCICLGEALEGTQVSYSIAGFTCGNVVTSYNHDGVSYHRIDSNVIFEHKPFNRSLRQSRGFIGAIDAHANNADRDAIAYAVNTLAERDEPRKVLIVLSDGYPAHRTANVSREELVRHTRKFVEDSNKRGVEVVGIGIQSDAVKEIYKDNIVVDSLQELSTKYLGKLMRILLK